MAAAQMNTPGQPRPSVAADPDDMKACPYCGEASGVKTITDTSPKVWVWSCAACGTDWAVTVVNLNLQVRPWWVALAEDLEALAVLQEITTLAEHTDTLTDDQLRARLLGCWARLNEVCRRRAASGFPAGYRPSTEVPGAQPVAPRGNGTAR